MSFSESNSILRGEVSFYPKGFTTTGYADVFSNSHIWRSYFNTFYVAILGCIASVTMNCMAAYPMAFGKFRGKKLYVFMIVFTMWFGGGLIPTYLVVSKLGLANTHAALILTALCAPYYIIILRTFFMSIPYSLIESVKLDGANDLQCLVHIVLPLSKAAIATIALWVVVGHWNNFLSPLMYLNDRGLYTLQVVLHDIVIQASGAMYEIADSAQNGDGTLTIPQQVQNAVIVVSMIPMLVIYPFVQKYFVKGVMLGSVKG